MLSFKQAFILKHNRRQILYFRHYKAEIQNIQTLYLL